MQIPFWHTPGFSRHSFMSEKSKKKHYHSQDIPMCDTQGLSLLLPLTFTIFSWSNNGSEAVGTQSFKGSWRGTEDRLYQLSLKTVRVCVRLCGQPSLSRGHSSQGSPQPSPGILLQQHLALVVFRALGTEHFPASNLVKQKLSLVSASKTTHKDLHRRNFTREKKLICDMMNTVAAAFVV